MGKMKVLFVAAEAAGLVKVGGLGDVARELPLKLKALGADVRLAIPEHQEIRTAARVVAEFPVQIGTEEETCILKEVTGTPVTTLLVGNERYFNRPSVYGYADDSERFAFFSLALYEWLKVSDFRPDVIHLNDWHTAPLAMLIRERQDEAPFLSESALVFTIHNLAYQGIGKREIFSLYRVSDDAFSPEGVEYYGAFNPMKAGIRYSDRFTAVSATGAHDMTTARFGYGLEGFIGVHKERLSGIHNGIDYDIWNPEVDPALFRNYSIDDPGPKAENKKWLQKQLGLETDAEAPLCGVVSRLNDIKGSDLLVPAAEKIIKSGGQMVILGMGSHVFEYPLKRLEKENPGRFAIRIDFDDKLARQIYAASDLFLMPSRYEPCGIGQLIAMRYGSVPVVHRVGGLADTVRDEATHPGSGTGFTYGADSMNAFARAIARGLKMYAADREGWKALIKRAMAFDSSWDRSAKAYMDLYREAAACRKQADQKGSGRKRGAPRQQRGGKK